MACTRCEGQTEMITRQGLLRIDDDVLRFWTKEGVTNIQITYCPFCGVELETKKKTEQAPT